MNRWSLSVAGLVLVANLACADYLMVVINVGQPLPPPATNQPGTAMLGAAGGQLGQPGAAGQVGAGGGAGAAGRLGGGAGAAGRLGGGAGGKLGGAAGGLGPNGGAGVAGNQGGTGKPIFIPLCVELTKKVSLGDVLKLSNPKNASQVTTVGHKWGVTHLLGTTGPIVKALFYRTTDGKTLPGTARRFEMELFKLGKAGPEATLELAERALTHGLHLQFEQMMDKLAQDPEGKNHPVVLTYLKVKADLAKRIDKLPSASWIALLSNSKAFKKDEKSPYYTVLHTLEPKEKSVIETRVNELDHLFRGFYYWWALRQQALPMPRERLVVMFTPDEDNFKHYYKGLSGDSVVYSGFHAPRENVLVQSLEPLKLDPQGEDYNLLKEFSEEYWKSPEEKKFAFQFHMPIAKIRSAEQVQAGILALALRSMEDAMEKAGISHNGSQQLLYTTGILPPHVIVPEWVQQGMSSIFETPPEHPWETLGAPHPVYLPLVRELKKKQQLENSDVATLRQVVTDGYFRQARANPKDKDAMRKAKATAWIVCYHLARKEPVKLQRYFQELAKLPPDLDLDGDILMDCFARAFDVWDTSKNKVDERRLDPMVRSWSNDLVSIPLEADDLVFTMHNLVKIVIPPPPPTTSNYPPAKR